MLHNIDNGIAENIEYLYGKCVNEHNKAITVLAFIQNIVDSIRRIRTKDILFNTVPGKLNEIIKKKIVTKFNHYAYHCFVWLFFYFLNRREWINMSNVQWHPCGKWYSKCFWLKCWNGSRQRKKNNNQHETEICFTSPDVIVGIRPDLI